MSLHADPSAAPPDPDQLFSPQSAATPAATPTSATPAGTGMLEERNADSVLFKLDQLQTDAPAPQSDPLSKLASSAPSAQAGGSGLIDLKAMMAGGSEPAAPSEPTSAASSSLLTQSSQTLGQTSSLASSSSALLPTPGLSAGESAVLPAPTPAKRTPLVVLSVLAGLALVAAVVAVVLRG